MAAIGLETDAPKLTRNEVKALSCDSKHSAIEQIKYVLRSAYKMFELNGVTNFSEPGWGLAQKFVDKRNKIMHPKSPGDIHVSEDEWIDVFEGSKWLIQEHFLLVRRLQAKYEDES